MMNQIYISTFIIISLILSTVGYGYIMVQFDTAGFLYNRAQI